jgi:hypothetical protein
VIVYYYFISFYCIVLVVLFSAINYRKKLKCFHNDILYIYNFLIKKIGCLLTGVFADQAVVSMAGDTSIKGGWVNGNVYIV